MERLTERKTALEQELTNINRAIEQMEDNPQAAAMVEALTQLNF